MKKTYIAIMGSSIICCVKILFYYEQELYFMIRLKTLIILGGLKIMHRVLYTKVIQKAMNSKLMA